MRYIFIIVWALLVGFYCGQNFAKTVKYETIKTMIIQDKDGIITKQATTVYKCNGEIIDSESYFKQEKGE